MLCRRSCSRNIWILLTIGMVFFVFLININWFYTEVVIIFLMVITFGLRFCLLIIECRSSVRLSPIHYLVIASTCSAYLAWTICHLLFFQESQSCFHTIICYLVKFALESMLEEFLLSMGKDISKETSFFFFCNGQCSVG